MNVLREYKKCLMGAVIVWVVSLILCLVAYIIVLRAQNNGKKRLENILAEQKQLYASAQRAAQEQTQIRLNEQIDHLRNQLRGFTIEDEKLTDLTFDISQIADRENLGSFSVTRWKRNSSRRGPLADAESETHQISENLIDISFNAEFHQFALFVNALERHHPVLFIDEFKINRSMREDSLYQASLDVAAFVRKQKNETADPASTSALSAKL